jgi:hypothetical protein
MNPRRLLAVIGLLSLCPLAAEEPGELIFSDDFERSESQEVKDEPGNGWGTNSRSRAKGNKQVDLREGAMFIHLSPEADHAVSVTQPAVFTDGSVGMRFRLDDAKDELGLNLADLGCKEVHAGHLFARPHQPGEGDLSGSEDGKHAPRHLRSAASQESADR